MNGNSSRAKFLSVTGQLIDRLEEVAIAVILGLMVAITFVNVVLRYVFNSGLIWGLEVTLVLFAWLVLFGVSHLVKSGSHLGVDVVLTRLEARGRRRLALLAALVCLGYAMLLCKGAWDYWAPFAGLYETTGRWFPIGFNEATRDRAWYETTQIPMLDFLRFLEPILNQGEEYEKLPRLIPYAILPIGAALLLLRLLQATWEIARGRSDRLIARQDDTDSPGLPGAGEG